MQQVAFSATTANSSAFITLGNLNPNLDSNGNSNSNSKWNKIYVYGLKHRFGDCFYIIKRKRP